MSAKEAETDFNEPQMAEYLRKNILGDQGLVFIYNLEFLLLKETRVVVTETS